MGEDYFEWKKIVFYEGLHACTPYIISIIKLIDLKQECLDCPDVCLLPKKPLRDPLAYARKYFEEPQHSILR